MRTLASRFSPASGAWFVAAAVLFVSSWHWAYRLQASGVMAQAQASEPQEASVDSRSDLLPSNADETALAKYFDSSGERLVGRVFLERVAHDTFEYPDFSDGTIEERVRHQRRSRICGAAAVVLGTVSDRRLLLNKSETFLFTSYRFDVSHWFRPKSGPRTIVVGQLGGKVLIEATREYFSTTAGTPLPAGATQVIFLRVISTGGPYVATGSPTVLEGPSTHGVAMPASQFRDFVRTTDSLAETCE